MRGMNAVDATGTASVDHHNAIQSATAATNQAPAGIAVCTPENTIIDRNITGPIKRPTHAYTATLDSIINKSFSQTASD
jgi:hypothetical protein